jgi:hypothetical protein
MDEESIAITVELPLGAWRTVTAHVERGVYADVWVILRAIYAQVNQQVAAARERAAVQAQAAERLVEAERQAAADVASVSQPEPTAPLH